MHDGDELRSSGILLRGWLYADGFLLVRRVSTQYLPPAHAAVGSGEMSRPVGRFGWRIVLDLMHLFRTANDHERLKFLHACQKIRQAHVGYNKPEPMRY